MNKSSTMLAVVGAVSGVVASNASAEIIFDTGAPEQGFFGFVGFDLSPNQSVAVAFTPTTDARLNSVSVWMMSNSFDGVTFPEFTLSLVAGIDDGGLGQPGTDVIENWDLTTSAIGFDPQQETARSTGDVILEAGTQYWVVGTSDAPSFENPVWVWGTGQAVNAIDNVFSPGWNVLDGGATPSIQIDATVIPVPASSGLVAAGLLFVSRRRRVG